MKQAALFDEPPPEWESADEEDVLVARVVLNIPVDTAFDYRIPDLFRGKVRAGQRVRVPFGRGDRELTGYCIAVERPQPGRAAGLKFLAGIVDEQPLLSAGMLELTRWIADRYLCAWGQVLDCVIPAGVKKQAGTRETSVVTLIATPETRPELKLTASSRRSSRYSSRRGNRSGRTNFSNWPAAPQRRLRNCGRRGSSR